MGRFFRACFEGMNLYLDYQANLFRCFQAPIEYTDFNEGMVAFRGYM